MTHRRGFTLIEALAVIAIIAILTALLIPAIQSAREAARRAKCLNNLHQVGIGLASYQADFSVFPAAKNGLEYSPLVQILPYIEQAAIFNSINQSISFAANMQVSYTLLGIRLETFTCPSDPGVSALPAATSYAGCTGDGILSSSGTNGMFAVAPPARSAYNTSAAITDGTSNTAAFSEWLVGWDAYPADRLRTIFSPGPPYSQWAVPTDDFVSLCRALDAMEPNPSIVKGKLWFLGISGSTLYNHALLIDDPSCYNTMTSPVTLGVSSSSSHASGAHLLMGDGHASFAKSSIALPVWRALSTRSGGEVARPD